jgi:hypothetical protein
MPRTVPRPGNLPGGLAGDDRAVPKMRKGLVFKEYQNPGISDFSERITLLFSPFDAVRFSAVFVGNSSMRTRLDVARPTAREEKTARRGPNGPPA